MASILKHARKSYVQSGREEDLNMAAPGTKTRLERDPVTLDSKHYKVELENDRVRIVRIDYGPDEGSVMHQHPPGTVIFLTDCDFQFTYPDGRSEKINAKQGNFLWFGEPWEHNPKNLSSKKFAALYIEVK